MRRLNASKITKLAFDVIMSVGDEKVHVYAYYPSFEVTLNTGAERETIPGAKRHLGCDLRALFVPLFVLFESETV